MHKKMHELICALDARIEARGYESDSNLFIASHGIWSPFCLKVAGCLNYKSVFTHYIHPENEHPDGGTVGEDIERAFELAHHLLSKVKTPAETRRAEVHTRLAKLLEDARDISLGDPDFTEGPAVIAMMEKAVKQLSHNIIENHSDEIAAE